MFRENPKKLVNKYIAIWAFSESAFGGLMHALKIPFTGLILGGIAVIFLSLINELVDSKKQIIKATLLVISIKFLLSPNTPFTAYLAVFVQGLLAFIFFSTLSSKVISISLLSLFSSIWSASQKVILTTLFFGMNFWYSIDELSRYIAKKFGITLDNSFSMSQLLIVLYFLLHLVGAVFIAYITINLPQYLSKHAQRLEELFFEFKSQNNYKTESEQLLNNKTQLKRKWYKKPRRWILVLFLLILSFLTFIDPSLKEIMFINVISMIVRALILIYLWFKVISPSLVKLLMYIIRKKNYLNGDHLKIVDDFKNLFPEFKSKIKLAWEINSDQERIIRIKNFLRDSILILIITK